jgi:predicted amidophosphoribosyltransferase
VKYGRMLAAAGELLLGSACHGCSEPSWGVCRRCRAAVLSHCCQPTHPDPCPAGFPLTVTTAPYDAILRQLIRAHKEHGALTLTPFLAGRLAAAIGALLQLTTEHRERIVLVPVPSTAAIVRERGYDATLAMARRAARILRPALAVRTQRLLRQARPVRDQVGLGAEERAANLRGAFRAVGASVGTAVILVDDVVTTGSSLTEAARALRCGGYRVLGAATVAATQRIAR